MSKQEKLIQKIYKGNSDVSPDEAIKILEMLNFSASPTRGSHRTFRKPFHPSITIVLTQNPLKPYLLEKIQNALDHEGYTNE